MRVATSRRQEGFGRRWGMALAVLCIPHVAPAEDPARAAEEAPLWSAAWITDTQTPDCEWIATLLARAGADKPRILIHTGDARFEWANRCAWRHVLTVLTAETGPVEFHLAPGNHDLENGVLEGHLRRAASLGIYRLDTGRRAAGLGYYHDRVTEEVSGPLWPVWNPEVAAHAAWQSGASKKPANHMHPEIPYRYAFKRGGVRFIVCDSYVTDEGRDWVRDLIVKPDDSSISILLQHKHEVDQLSRYFEGLEGRHNVKLVLSGDHHLFCREERGGVTFITGAGIARGAEGENDAMALWVYPDRLRLDRYVIPPGRPLPAVKVEEGIWSVKGKFTAYVPPEHPSAPAAPAAAGDGREPARGSRWDDVPRKDAPPGPRPPDDRERNP